MRENLMRGDSIQATNYVKAECVHGHSFDAENTYYDRFGHRHCRMCGKLKMRRRRAS